MKRIAIGFVWAGAFFIASCFTIGFVAGFQAGFKNPNNPERAQKAAEEAATKLLEEYSLGILVGSCICAAVLAGAGVLPGTQPLAIGETRSEPSA